MENYSIHVIGFPGYMRIDERDWNTKELNEL